MQLFCKILDNSIKKKIFGYKIFFQLLNDDDHINSIFQFFFQFISLIFILFKIAMESYIEEKKKLYTIIHEFLENDDDEKYDIINNKKYFHEISEIIKSQKIERNCEEMKQFLQIIK